MYKTKNKQLLTQIQNLIQSLIRKKQQPVSATDDFDSIIFEGLIPNLLLLSIREPSAFLKTDLDVTPKEKTSPRNWIDIAFKAMLPEMDGHIYEKIMGSLSSFIDKKQFSNEIPGETQLLREVVEADGEWIKIQNKKFTNKLIKDGLIEIREEPQGIYIRINPLIKETLNERLSF